MRATTRTLDEQVDLNDIAAGDGVLFVRNGVGIAGRGVAARVEADAAVEFLASIEHDDRRDASARGVGGPVALGAVPFVPGSAASLLVPSLVVGRDAEGCQWVTEISGGDEPPASVVAAARPSPRAQAFTVRPLTPVDRYLAAVAAARDAVRDGRLLKAVIAREVLVESDEPIDVHAVLLRLRASFGSSHRYSVDGFVGASPELLVAREGSRVTSLPLAGTTPRTGDPDTDARAAAALLASAKNQVEHRVVIDMIHDTLLPWVSYLDWEPEPSVVAVANVQHLATALEGRLSSPIPSVIELVRALSPTPALGGHPRDAALQLIAEHEGVDRGRYGGAVGWVDAHGDGRWAVAIRCAEFSDDRRSARLIAGGGIVADSDPLDELAETQAKLQAMLSAIVRP
jgi:menaquinone-specific isochorismate synthase